MSGSRAAPPTPRERPEPGEGMLGRHAALFLLLILTVAAMGLLRPGGDASPDAPAEAVSGEPSPTGALSPEEDDLRDAPPEVAELLRSGRSWRAARLMREHLRENPDASPERVLVAARAEAGWGGWDRVRELLQGNAWLDEAKDGEGWYWLARALEEEGRSAEALDAYTRFLAASEGGSPRLRRVAMLRQGVLLLGEGRTEEGAEVLESARRQAGDAGPWLDLLAAEALAERGDTAAVRARVASEAVQALGARGPRARIRAMEVAGDPAGARALALRYRERAADTDRALYSLIAGRLARELGAEEAARADLRAALATPGSRSAAEAARLLSGMPGITDADRLAVATVRDRHGANAQAAAGYRAWLRSGRGTPLERQQVRLRMGKALFDAGEYREAINALDELSGAPSAIAAEALLLVGRAQYRSGSEQAALRTFARVAERFPGSEAGSEALFLVADLAHDDKELTRAAQTYRRVATGFPGTDRAGLSLMRLGGIRFHRGAYADAAAAWEEYRQRHPTGDRWLESTYWAGRSYEEAGDVERARARYREVRAREPLSYYSLRAAERLDEEFWPSLGEGPPEDPAVRRQVEGWMRGLDLLRAAGLEREAEAEAARLVARVADDRGALAYTLAEELNSRGFTGHGIRIGRRLEAGGTNPRLLRILYPLPYRDIIVAESRERKLDPFMTAALIRQESMFKAGVSSPVGARGLMQIMPKTGVPLARAAGISGWSSELLFQPEINVHLGTMYLAEQIRNYGGSLPSVFSAYNAGPRRVERWSRFPEYGDEELFTERIPYRETRDYVKILTRNAAIYRALYAS